MTASSANAGAVLGRATPAPRRAPALSLVLVLVLALVRVGGPAVAQDDPEATQPLRLGPTPPSESEAESADQNDGLRGETGGETGDETQNETRENRGGGRDIEGVEVDRLDAPDPAGVGTLDPGGRGLRATMWRGTARHVAMDLLPQMPGEIDSAALRDLAARFLLSAATPPERRRSGGHGGESLLDRRVARLSALGAFEGVVDLMRVVPRRAHHEGLARHEATALFLLGRVEDACVRTEDWLKRSDAAYWQKVLAICQMARGETNAAALSVSLLRETGDAAHAPFLRAFDALADGTLDTLDPTGLDRLALALLFTGDAPLSAHFAGPALNAGILAAVAGHTPTPLPLRAAAAEIAVARGALPPARLHTIYEAFDFADTRLAEAPNPALAATPPDALFLTPAARRALHFQAARQSDSTTARAEILRAVFEAAPSDLLPGLYRAFAPILGDMPARPALAWFATQAGRGLYATGQDAAAARWITMAREESLVSPEAAASLATLWPHAQIAGDVSVPLNGGLSAWRRARSEDAAGLALRESLLKAAFEALESGETRPWIELAAAEDGGGGRAVPSAARLYALRDAGAARRVGETVLLSVIVLGHTGLAEVHPLTLHTALRALNRVDLDETARRLAIEAALYNGI